MPDIQVDGQKVELGSAVAGAVNLGLISTISDSQAVSATITAAEKHDGPDVYANMLRDDAVGSSLEYLIDKALSEGFDLHPADFAGLDSDRAIEIQEFCQYAIDQLSWDIETTVADMLRATVFGCRVAELVYKLVDGKMLIDIVPIPHNTFKFVVTTVGRSVLGLLVDKKDKPLSSSDTLNPTASPNFMPVQKFLIYTNRSQHADPRGQSDLDRAFNAWKFKRQAISEHYAHLVRHGSGMLIGYAAPSVTGSAMQIQDGMIKLGADGQPERVTAEVQLLTALEKLGNGARIALPHGAKVEAIFPTTNGEAFTLAIQLCDTAIARAILGANRATQEAANGSRADSQTAERVIMAKVRRMRSTFSKVFRRQYLARLVEVNFGADAVPYTPVLSLGQFEFDSMLEASEFARNLGVQAETTNQKADVARRVRMPEPDPEEIAANEEKDALLAQQLSAAISP